MGDPKATYQLVLTTVGSEEQALCVARGLVERRLAACVSILPVGCSVYRWQDKIEEEEEKLLLIKTTEQLFPRVSETIRELHSYEVPEIIAIPILRGDPDYLRWLGDSVARPG